MSFQVHAPELPQLAEEGAGWRGSGFLWVRGVGWGEGRGVGTLAGASTENRVYWDKKGEGRGGSQLD